MTPAGRLFAILAIALLLAWAAPGLAHHHDNEAVEAAEQAEAAPTNLATAPMLHQRSAIAIRTAAPDAPPATIGGRTLAWLGHLHPFAVHFPVALIPLAWFALIVARRRGEGLWLIRGLVVIAGLAALIAGTLGWLDAGAALIDRDPVQTAHRWTGTALALGGAALALAASRKPGWAETRGAVPLLATLTLIVLIQAGLGALLTHGWAHLRF